MKDNTLQKYEKYKIYIKKLQFPTFHIFLPPCWRKNLG